VPGQVAEKNARAFRAYLENVQARTGLTVADFRAQAAQKGLTTHRELLAWLKTDLGLGHGHAQAVIATILNPDHGQKTADDHLTPLFAGKKAHWRPLYDTLMGHVQAFGPDVETTYSKAYVSLFRPRRFASLHPASADRFDIGLNLKGTEPAGRLEAAGSWNRMVTHRVRIADPAEVDDEVYGWLRQAYDQHQP